MGAMKTIPITEMEKTAEPVPLEGRREYKALAQSEKPKRLPSHTLHTKVDSLTKNRLKRQSLNHIVKNLQKEMAEVLEPGVDMLQSDSW